MELEPEKIIIKPTYTRDSGLWVKDLKAENYAYLIGFASVKKHNVEMVEVV